MTSEELKAHKRTRAKIFYYKHRERNLAVKKAYGIKNRPKLIAKCKSYYDANRERLLEYAKQYRAANPDRINLRNRKYCANNRDKVRKWCRKWAKKNPHKVALYEAARRLLEKNAVVNLSGLKQFYGSVRSKKRVSCYYCGAHVAGKLAHFDHIVPLTKGGQHSSDNLCVSCPTCNFSKHNKALSEWKRHAQGFLSL